MPVVTALEQAAPTQLGSESTFYGFTEAYWQEHQDLMPQEFGAVAMVRLGEEGKVLEAYSPERMCQNLSVILDARTRANGAFLWQITEASTSGRNVVQLTASGDFITGRQYELDAQGRLTRLAGLTDGIDAAAQKIVSILKLPIVTRVVSELRTTRGSMITSVKNFKDDPPKLGKALYQKRLQEKEQVVARGGFTPLALYEQKGPPIGRTLSLVGK
jgi:hypothetical protein